MCARAAANPIQTLCVSTRVRECRSALQNLEANSRMAQILVHWTSETGLARCRVQLAMTSPFENCGENAMNRMYGVCFDCQFLHPCFARSHPCCSQSSKEDFEDSPRGERSDAPVQELPKPKFGKRTYQRLAGAWSDMRQPTQLRQNMWVAVESLCGPAMLLRRDHQGFASAGHGAGVGLPARHCSHSPRSMQNPCVLSRRWPERCKSGVRPCVATPVRR